MSNKAWDNDLLQFARLLAEIRAIRLSDEQYDDLSKSMGLGVHEIDSLFSRAEEVFEQEKESVFNRKTS